VIIDCPIADKRTAPAPDGQLAGVFFHEWMAGRKKNGSVNHRNELTFRLPVDADRIRMQCGWATESGKVDAVLLNWETLPAVPSRDVPKAWRYDDAFALARTVDLIRENIRGVRVDVFGIRPWIMHFNHIQPDYLWDIYFACGVQVDSINASARGFSADRTARFIDARLNELARHAPEAELSILTDGRDAEQSEVIAKCGLPEIRWYRPISTEAK
jgi:hypothetical protein